MIKNTINILPSSDATSFFINKYYLQDKLFHYADKTVLDIRGLSVFDLAAQQGNETAIAILEN